MPLRRPVALVALVVVLLAASCSGGDDDAGPSSSADGSGGSATSAGPGETPVAGGTLRIGIARASLDPADASPQSPSAAIVADLLYDGLTTVGPDGVAVPAVASEWSTPDGGVTWRFTLRPDATFADGRAVTPNDVKTSIERVKARGGSSLIGARLDVVAEVRPVDESVVEIVLTRPMASLPELLAAPALGIVDATSGAPAANGSGPFRVSSGEGSDVVTLARSASGDALLDGVEVHQFDDLAAAVDAFSAGDLDWTLVPPERAEQVAESVGADGFVPFQAELFFGFNLADPTFADARFRRAIVTAVDRAAVVSAVYFGFASALSGVVPSGVAGHDPARCGPGCAPSVDESRRLLAEVFPPGSGAVVPEVVIDHEDSAEETALAQAVEQQLEAAGIPASLRPHAAADFGAFAVSGQQALVRLGWIGAWPGADAYLSPLFRTGAPDNVTGFSDPAVDLLLDAADRALDAAERRRLLGEAESLVLAAAPIVPIAQFHLLSAASPAVRDLSLTVAGTFDAEAVWLAE